ncbi:MAG: UDP-2,4-diacetamido-2,4,6-trideoxy-beta-L-altropyranose hydrolase [Thermodesulfobacteriota bacterium]
MSGQLLIRADADGRIGTGHVMRCLALAQAWRRLSGGPVVFAGRIESAPLRQRLRDEGFSLCSLPVPASPEAEAAFLAERFSDPVGGWLALDGYHFDAAWQLALRAAGLRLLVIDDAVRLPLYHADCLLNPGIHAETLRYPCEGEPLQLLGCNYALLREEFTARMEEALPVTGRVRNLLLTMGGADPGDCTKDILLALAKTGRKDLRVRAVLGGANPHRPALAGLLPELPFPCELLEASRDMAGLMRHADAAISAAGTTVYELAAMGVPFLSVVIAANQRHNAAAFASAGAAGSLGEAPLAGRDGVAERIAAFLEDGQQRQRQAEIGRRLVDGRGASRVAAALLAAEIELRPATWADRMLLLRWANQPATRRHSFHSAPISQAEHERWIAGKLADRGCRLWLLRGLGSTPFGVVRFDVDGDRAEISVNLDEEFQGLGIGGRAIALACDRLLAEHPCRIEARVKEGNPASLRAFAGAGFVESTRAERQGVPFVTLVRNPESHDARPHHR